VQVACIQGISKDPVFVDPRVERESLGKQRTECRSQLHGGLHQRQDIREPRLVVPGRIALQQGFTNLQDEFSGQFARQILVCGGRYRFLSKGKAEWRESRVAYRSGR
jgi:hypothetical protein